MFVLFFVAICAEQMWISLVALVRTGALIGKMITRVGDDVHMDRSSSVENFFPPLFSLSEIFFRIADLSVSTSFALLYHSLPKRSPTLAETCSRTRSASLPRLPLWVPMAKPTLRTTKASRRRECPTLDFWNTWTWAESRRLICTPTVRSRSWKRFRRNWATECKESESVAGTSGELLQKFREKNVDFAAHSESEDTGGVFLNLLGNLAFPLLLVGGLFLLTRRSGGAGGGPGMPGNGRQQPDGVW